ncbi:hypothetical protein [Crenothrix sp.]|uniref:hypothetical protein n=1 Tax=Crenothrix sp. TaxID=3100433 RepID=UPI00374CFCD9
MNAYVVLAAVVCWREATLRDLEWFVEGIAYGSQVGEPATHLKPNDTTNPTDEAFYMPIDYISGINAAVLTTP